MKVPRWWLWVVVLVGLHTVGAYGQAGPGVDGVATVDLRDGRQAITVVSTRWRFHAGDDRRWATPDFGDGEWSVMDAGKGWDAQGYREVGGMAWFRFRLAVPAKTSGLALTMPAMTKSYQIFADGRMVGQSGELPPDRSKEITSAPRVFTLPVTTGERGRVVSIALRLWQDPRYAVLAQDALRGQVLVGAPDVLMAQFAQYKGLRLLQRFGLDYTTTLVQLPIAAAALLLFLLTRQRFYLWFGLYMVIDVFSLATHLLSQHFGWSFAGAVLAYALWDFLGSVTLAMFVAGLLELRSLRPVVWAIGLMALAEVGPLLVTYHLPVVWADGSYFVFEAGSNLILLYLLFRATRRREVGAGLFLVSFVLSQGLGTLSNLGHFLESLGVPVGRFILGDVQLLETPFPVTLGDLSDLIALFGFLAVLVYRFARTSQEEQRLSAALRAAHEIQGRLVPADQTMHEGLRTEVVYLAAEEVGGDFCQVLPRGNGSVLIAIGDVSGKGLQAAMVGALAVGALRSMADEDAGPATVLRKMNEVMMRSDTQGFTTCLCLEIERDGTVTMANAGHLAPYVNGVEVDCGSGLPLGLVGGMRYEQRTMTLPREARLTLLSDGVVEARSATGELFGFGRTLEVSGKVAEEIAAAARRFGQQDDITVLTLEWSAPRLEFLAA